MIKVLIGEKHPLSVMTLIDSGSARSIIHQKIVKRLEENFESLAIRSSKIQCMYTIKDQSLCFEKEIDLSLKTLCGKIISGTFLISDEMSFDILIGRDIMDAFRIIPSVHHRTVWIEDAPVLFCESSR